MQPTAQKTRRAAAAQQQCIMLTVLKEIMTESTKNKRGLKEKYRSAYLELSRLVEEADPVQLIAASAPTDEYGPEVASILSRLHETRSVEDVQRMVHEVFVRWFGPDIAGQESDYTVLSKSIWAWSTQPSVPQ